MAHRLDRMGLLVVIGMVLTALSGCGGGGGDVEMPPLTLTLPGNHALSGVITVNPDTSQDSGNVTITCPEGGQPCEVTIESDDVAAYEGGKPTITPAPASLPLPANHDLDAGVIPVDADASEQHGNVEFSCPAGGPDCVIVVAPNGTVAYLKTGGTPTVMVVQAALNLPEDHGLGAGVIPVAPGASEQRGNVVIMCPANGPACQVWVAPDGTATYPQTGGAPTVTPVRADLDLPENHGLGAGRFAIAPGASQRSGNVELLCPANGPACRVSIESDGTAIYEGGRPTVMPTRAALPLPENHDLGAGGITIAPGASQRSGNVEFSCPAGGPACEVVVASDGSAEYLQTGGMPTIMAASAALSLPANHGLGAGGITVAPGASQRSGNVEIACPAGAPVCEVRVASDGSAEYLQTGGMPTIMAARATLNLPANHGLGTGGITVAPGASQKSGNVEIACPDNGPACEVRVALDGSASYLETGGMPTVMAAQLPLDLPDNHGLNAGVILLEPGTSVQRGNLEFSCPAGGPACEVIVVAGGSAAYLETGGMPTVMAALERFAVPDNHGLAVGALTVAPGASEERGNVVITCPSGGPACEVIVASDGAVTYLETGGEPTVVAAREPFAVPANHGLAAGDLMLAPGTSEARGNVVITCPAGGPSCEVIVAADGTAQVSKTGATPTVMAAQATLGLPVNHDLSAGGIAVAPGTSQKSGNVEFTCPAGGPSCEVRVAADGTATYLQTGGMPAVMAARATLDLPANHGLNAGATVAAGVSEERGNVVIACPAGGPACEVRVASDGSVTYLQTGGVPTVMAAQATFDLPANHGVAAGDLTVAPGASEERGNVVITCPASGPACEVRVAPNGSAAYLQTGGMPTSMPAQAMLDLPANHGLNTGLTVAAGISEERGNVEISCPAGGPACEVRVASDGSVTYLQTGGMPTVMAVQLALTLPANHGVNAGVTVAPGASEQRGNVVITCPAGGPACEVVVASDGTAAYLKTGAVPSVMPARTALSLPANHGLTAGALTVAPGGSEQRGNVNVTCPPGDLDCVVVVADGSAVYLETGGMPSVMAARVDLADLPPGSLDAGDVTIRPGGDRYQRGVKVVCPADGFACEAIVKTDGSAVYLQTGGAPEVLTHELVWTLNGPEADRASNVFKRDAARDAAESEFDYLQATSDDLVLVDVTHTDDGLAFELGITGAGDLHDALDGIKTEDHRRNTALPDLGEGWTGVALALPGAGTTTHVNVYSDIKQEISADENNPVGFPGAALNSHTILSVDANADFNDEVIDFFLEDKGFSGTFDEIRGYFACADVSGCIVAPQDSQSNAFTFQDQQWTFQPDRGEEFVVRDEDYLSLGVWLTVPEKTDFNPDILIGSFATGSQPFENVSDIEAIEGIAAYRGKAIGLYEKRSSQDFLMGSFVADTMLTARFGSASSAGNISGTIRNFTENDQTLGDWTVDLKQADLDDTSLAYTAGAAINSNLYSPLKPAGTWVAKPYGPGETDADPPSALAGWFESEAGLRDDPTDNEYLGLTGAFGAHRQ